MKVSKYVCGAVRQFSYWFAHGTIGYPLLEGIDYVVVPAFEYWETELYPVSENSYVK